MPDELTMRVHGDASLPTLIYLPGMHGDWTLVSSFRAALGGRVRFVEISYPRTIDWTADQYAIGVMDALAANEISEGWVLAESFSSQVAWTMLNRAAQSSFRMKGLIMAGGFVRYPLMPAVYLAHGLNRAVPLWILKLACGVYAQYAKFRHRHAPETLG